jgi:hypothetical protein
MTAEIKITTSEFFRMYKYIVSSYNKDLDDAIKHNLRYADRLDMQIVISPLPYEGVLDYIRQTLKRLCETSDVIWIGRRGNVLIRVKKVDIPILTYKHPQPK